MADAFQDFEWSVTDRYEWVDWLDAEGNAVVVPDDGLARLRSASAVEALWNHADSKNVTYGPLLQQTVVDSKATRHYRPMDREHAALFRMFADLDYQKPAEILEFAQKYGALGLPRKRQSLRILGSTKQARHHSAYGEPFLSWAFEIVLMREGIRSVGKPITTDRAHRLKWLFDRSLQQIQGRLTFGRDKKPRLALEPLTLIGALWLQLAMAVTGDKRFISCKHCGRLIELSTSDTGFRRHKLFCSDSCKTLDYRKRHRAALEEAAKGRTVRDIADRLQTNTTTIKSWLDAEKRRGSAKATGGK